MKRRALTLLREGLLAMLVGVVGAAQDATPAAEPAVAAPPSPVTVSADRAPAAAVAHRIEKIKKAISANDEAALNRAATEVDLLRRTYGTLDMTPLVDGLLLWARLEGKDGRREQGLKAVDLAERWAPGLPEVLSLRITLLRSSGPMGYFSSLPDLYKLNQLRLRHPTHLWLWLVHHLAWLRMMATLLLWGWALTLALRYRRVFPHIWEEPLQKRGLNGKMIALIGALLLAGPVLVGLDPSVAAVVWLYLLAPYLLTDEVKLTVLVLGLQIVHPALALIEPMAVAEPVPSIVSYQTQPQVKPHPPELLERLPKGDRSFLQAWEQMQNQDWGSAVESFRALSTTHPDRGEVFNNLGVAEFHLGRKEEASKSFDSALRSNPDSPEILINQSILAFEQIDTPLGSAKLDSARRANPAHFEHLMSVNQALKQPRAFPLPLPDNPERVRLLAEILADRKPIPWSQRVPLLSLLMGFLLPIAGVSLFLRHLQHSLGLAHPTQCIRCGEAFHTTDSPDPNVCGKCHHLFVLRDGLHQESRKKKLDEVAIFQTGRRRIHRILITLLPGCDTAFLGHTREGFLEFGFLCLAVGLVWATGRTVRYPGEIIPDPTSTWMPLGAIILISLYVRSWLKLPKRRS